MDDHNSCETRRGLIDYHMGKLMSLKLMEGLETEKVELKEITSGKHHQNSLVFYSSIDIACAHPLPGVVPSFSAFSGYSAQNLTPPGAIW